MHEEAGKARMSELERVHALWAVVGLVTVALVCFTFGYIATVSAEARVDVELQRTLQVAPREVLAP